MKTKIFKHIGISIISLLLVSSFVYASTPFDGVRGDGTINTGDTISATWYTDVSKILMKLYTMFTSTTDCPSGQAVTGFNTNGTLKCTVQTASAPVDDYFQGRCDTENIHVPTGCTEGTDGCQVWAACNVGAAFAGVGSVSYGGYYTFDNAIGMCPYGYKLPTKQDWLDACTSILGITCIPMYYDNTSFVTTLKLPGAGGHVTYADSYGQDTNGYYWSSTPVDSTYAFILNFGVGYNLNPANDHSSFYRFSVRCIKN